MILTRPSSLPRADLHLEAPVTVAEGAVEFACRLTPGPGPSRRLWFRFPAHEASLVTRKADPFLLAVLIHAMGRFSVLHVHGDVSAGLIPNLREFQTAFAIFQHWKVPPIEITADGIGEAPSSARGAAGISAMSGGVDSCFSLLRHTHVSTMEPKRPLRAALFMHGFDIPLEQTEVFARTAGRCAEIAGEAGLRLLTGATNLRTLPVPWETTFASAVAASLSFFQSAYAFGLVPSFHDYAHTNLEHGSNPLTDPMLSSLAFGIVHDGAGFGRIDKLRQLATWPGALRRLRVCWQGDALDRNCCRCEKCVRTILMLNFCGVHECEAFPLPVGKRELDGLVIKSQAGLDELSYLLSEARAAGRREPWMAPLGRALVRNRLYLQLKRTGRAARSLLPTQLHQALHSAAQRLLRQSAPPRAPSLVLTPPKPVSRTPW